LKSKLNLNYKIIWFQINAKVYFVFKSRFILCFKSFSYIGLHMVDVYMITKSHTMQFFLFLIRAVELTHQLIVN